MISRTGLLLALTVLLVGQPTDAVGQALAPPTLNDGWRTASPSEVGLDADALAEMTKAVEAGDYGNVHAILIERHERLVYEAYFSGPDQARGRTLGDVEFGVGVFHDLRSVSKSITSALVGAALAGGDLGSVDTRVAELLPEWAELLDGKKGDITLRHLLTMSSGLEWDEAIPYFDPQNDERRLDESDDPVGFVLGRDLLHEPGSVWNYAGGSTQLLGVIVEKAVRRPLAEYADEVLFGPLGIDDVEWLGDLDGTPSAASGLRLRPRDLAKFGSLFSNAGRWNDVQVLQPEWIEASHRSHIENADPSAPSFVSFEGYGYQWWVNTYETSQGRLDLATAVGNGGQRLVVIPSLDLTVTILSGFYNEPDHFWTPELLLLERILPAVDSTLPSKKQLL